MSRAGQGDKRIKRRMKPSSVKVAGQRILDIKCRAKKEKRGDGVKLGFNDGKRPKDGWKWKRKGGTKRKNKQASGAANS